MFFWISAHGVVGFAGKAHRPKIDARPRRSVEELSGAVAFAPMRPSFEGKPAVDCVPACKLILSGLVGPTGQSDDVFPSMVPGLGIDPVRFGLVIVLDLMLGLLHPPMGWAAGRRGGATFAAHSTFDSDRFPIQGC